MPHTTLTFRAIAPVHSPLTLHLGVDQFSLSFIQSLKAININDDSDQANNNWLGHFLDLGGKQNQLRQYQSTDQNSRGVQLMAWSPLKNNESDDNIMFHIFTNNIAIAEIELTLELSELFTSNTTSDNIVNTIEAKVQNLAAERIERHLKNLYQDLLQLKLLLSDDFILSDTTPAKTEAWIARTMVLNDQQLEDDNIKKLLTSWLKKTSRPEDALDIISGKKDFSMTWLNYAVKNAKPVGEDPHIEMMILSQYYYVSQENCNRSLRNAIEVAYARHKKEKIDKVLAKTRTACRLNQITFFENIKFLNKPNRAMLEDILDGWKFNQLVENSERMIEICDARLQEEDNKKRERSTVMTDFLLVTLSFFAVFELSLYLTEFSREMMSRPALDYNDNKSSFFLGLIAEVDADIMFSFGFGLTLLLIIVYRYIKRN